MKHLPSSTLLVAALLLTACPAPEYEGDDGGECSDGADNDLDGTFDCLDEGCAASPDCSDDDDDTAPDDDDTAPDDDDTAPDDDDTAEPEGAVEDGAEDAGGSISLSSPGGPSSSCPGDTPAIDVPWLSQKIAGNSWTGNMCCGPSVITMFQAELEGWSNPGDGELQSTIDWMTANLSGWTDPGTYQCDPGGTNNLEVAQVLLDYVGVTSADSVTTDWCTLKGELTADRVAIVHVPAQGGNSTPVMTPSGASHWMVLESIQSNMALMNDPGRGTAGQGDSRQYTEDSVATAFENFGGGLAIVVDFGSSPPCYGDLDDDGYGIGVGCADTDCDDSEPLAWTGAPEVCGDGVDNDCVDGDAGCPTIEVTAPGAGDELQHDVEFTVTWTSANVVGNVLVHLYEGGSHFMTLAGDTANTGSLAFNPTPAGSFPADTDYAICVGAIDGSADDCGDLFAIVEASDPCDVGESWTNNIDDNCNGYVDEFYVDDQASFDTTMSFAAGPSPITDLVVIEPGTYTLTSSSHQLGAGISWIGLGGPGAVTIDLQGGFIEAQQAGSSISGLTLTNGGGFSGGNRGGAIYVNGVSLTITDVVIQNSSASFGGGIAVYYGGVLDGTGLTVASNSGGRGGGIYAYDSEVTLNGALLIENEATSNDGGGLALDSGSSGFLTNVVVADNSAVSWGGGIHTEVPLALTNVTAVGNAASVGGGLKMFSASAVVDVTSSMFYANTAATGGGNIDWNSGTLTMGYSLYAAGTPNDLYGGGWNPLVGNISGSAPNFVGYSANSAYDDDYDLLAGSPGFDAGDPAAGSDADGSANDMGAYGGAGATLVP